MVGLTHLHCLGSELGMMVQDCLMAHRLHVRSRRSLISQLTTRTHPGFHMILGCAAVDHPMSNSLCINLACGRIDTPVIDFEERQPVCLSLLM